MMTPKIIQTASGINKSVDELIDDCQKLVLTIAGIENHPQFAMIIDEKHRLKDYSVY